MTALSLDTVFAAFSTYFQYAIAFLQNYGVSLTINDQTFTVSFFNLAVSFSFLCFFFMLCFPHFYYEDDESEL